MNSLDSSHRSSLAHRVITLATLLALIAMLLSPLATLAQTADGTPADPPAAEEPAPDTNLPADPTATAEPTTAPVETVAAPEATNTEAPAPTETNAPAPANTVAFEPTSTTAPEPTATRTFTEPPTIQSDKADYGPGERVTLTGANWQAGESVHIYVNDDHGSSWSRNVDVVADDAGHITDAFNLPDWFVATYIVRATGSSSGSATATFTDAAIFVRGGFTGGANTATDTLSLTYRRFSNANCGGNLRNGDPSSVAVGTSDVNVPQASQSSARLTAAGTSTGGRLFVNWTDSSTGSIVSTAAEWCVNYPSSGNDKTYIANYAAPANSAPVANSQNLTTDEDTAKGITLSATDPDGDALTYAIVTGPSNGTLGTLTGNTITYTPNANYNGADSFTFAANDGKVNSNTATVSISVTAVNDAPVANSQSVTTPEDTAKAITLTGSDVEGNGLTYSVVTSPAHGTLSGTAPNLTYTPAANHNGPDSFTFKVNDGTTDSSPATVSISVTDVNDAPVANNGSASVDEDSTNNPVTLGASDVDGDGLTYSIVSGPSHGTLSGTGSSRIYTPAPNYNGPDSFTFKANDGTVDSNVATFSITVGAVNDAPVAANDSATTAEDTPIVVTVLSNDSDVDGDTLTVVFVGSPSHGTATLITTGPDANKINYTPAANYNGPDSFTYKISDGTADSNTATVSITVTAVNDAPVASNQSVTTDEDTGKAITLTATDVDGDALSYSIVNGPAHGTLSAVSGNSVTYTPAANYNGPDSFTFKASDGSLDSNTASVSITVAPVNDAPVADDQSVETDEDTLVDIYLVSNDLDNASLTYSIVDGPTHGTLSALSGNHVVYTPDPNYNGSDSFTFKASDGSLDSNTATVDITVTAVNDAPVAVDRDVVTDEDVAVEITLTGSDVEGDSLTFAIVDGPTHGSLNAVVDGKVTYTPNANFNGSDSFTFKANDGIADSNVATVSITVDAVNDDPVAQDDEAETAEDTAVDIDVLANDSDVDGDSLSVSAVTQGTHGAVTFTVAGVTYAPAANYNGADSFTYTISDGHGGTATGTVSVTVTEVNDAPTAADDTATTAEDTAATFTQSDLTGNDSAGPVDEGGQTLTVTSVGSAVNGSVALNGDGTVTFTPDPNFNGPASFAYMVTDNGTTNGANDFRSDVASVTITVTEVNDVPVAADDSKSTNEDTPLSFPAADLVANDSAGPNNENAQTLTVTTVGTASHGTVALVSGTITYTPAANYNGPDSFTYTVSDNGTTNGVADPKSASATVSITINAVNDAPVAVDKTLDDAHQGVAKTVTLEASDIDSAALTFAITQQPAHGTLGTIGAVSCTPAGLGTHCTATVTYTADAGYEGSDLFKYKASDGALADSADATVSIDVVNSAPVAVDSAETVDEDSLVNVTLHATDVDGDGLTYSILSGPSHGELSLVVNNTVTYTPNSNYNGPDSFTFKANDGIAYSNAATVTITVNSVNDAPVAQDDTGSTAEDTAVAVAVLANDSDVDGDSLSVSAVTQGTHGTVTFTSAGVTYAPAANYNGGDSFTYTIIDGNGGSDTAKVDVTVTPVNDAPVADNQSVTTDEDTPKAVTLNGSDVDGDTLTYSVVSGPSHGTLGAVSGNSVTYTPAANYNGSDSFTFKANDGTVDSNTATVSITVTAVNDAPVAQSQSVSTDEDTAKAITLGATDVDGDSLTYTVVSGPSHGTLSGSGATRTYTPAANYNGPDSFTFKANDGTVDSNVATVSITVNPVNDAPTVSITSFTVDPTTRMASTVTTYGDVDGLSDIKLLKFEYLSGATVIASRSYTFASNGTGSKTDSTQLPAGCYANLKVVVTVTDAAGLTGSDDEASSATVDAYGLVFQEPIKNNERNLAKAGNVVPVKVNLVSSCTGQTTTTVSLYVQVVKGMDPDMNTTSLPSDQVETTVSVADSGTQMRVNGSGYIYNLSTKPLTTGADYTIRIFLGDPTNGGVIIGRAVLRTSK